MVSVSLNKLINFFEHDFACLSRQSSWDNSGRQIYTGEKTITKLCLALDPSEQVVSEAISRGCELLITHHPLFFSSFKKLDIANTSQKIAVKALQNKLDILSYHTNLDIADDGLNTWLIKLLGAVDGGFLEQEGGTPLYKLVVFVPLGHENNVLEAISQAGGGQMGTYRRCAFSSTGRGTFTPLNGSNPFIGKVGKAEEVDEIRLELLVSSIHLKPAIAALLSAHPYETPAYDIIPLENKEHYGAGRIGNFEKPMQFDDFAALIKEKLSLDILRGNMLYTKTVARFGLCTGSGASLWKACVRHGIDLLLTGDLKHHDALDARAEGVCILDAGHFHTERVYMQHLADVLKEKFGLSAFIAHEEPSLIEIGKGGKK